MTDTRPLPGARGRSPGLPTTSTRMGRVPAVEFLDLLAREAAAVEFEGPVLAARAAGAGADELAELERAKALALQVRALLEARRRRESELSALFDTAGDLASLTEVDAVLEAIVHRARRLLHSDVAYLSLNDDAAGETYMRVTEGTVAASFRAVRLPMGAGLGGLVAQTATPYATADYFDDERFRHTAPIDSAVRDEGLRSILGVPLLLGKQVIGVLYAANREVRPFTHDDVTLLASLAAHAAIAIDNARLLAETQQALAELEAASEQLRTHTESVERAADAHDRLTRIVLRGGGADDVVRAVRDVLGAEVLIVAPGGSVIASSDPTSPPTEKELGVVEAALRTSRTVADRHAVVSPVVAGAGPLGALVLRSGRALEEADQRILERSALVAALLLLFRRGVAEAEGRVRGELLEDVLAETVRDPAGLRERARLLGADLDQPHAVVVADLVGDRGRTGEAAAYLAGVNGGFASVRHGHVVVILPDTDPRDAAALLQDRLRAVAAAEVTVGAAGQVAGLEGLAAGYAEARRCLDALLALGHRGRSATAEDLGFVGLLLSPDRDARGFVASTLGPVLEYDAARGTRLVDTLEAYFRTGGNLTRAAGELHVHVNTVTQRLERVSRLLGEGWQEPERQLELQLALRLHRLTA